MSSQDVYVVTLQFDAATFERLAALRTRYFPPALNRVPAHLTLLHSASLDQTSRLKQSWSQFDHVAPPVIRFTGLRSLGRGTALTVESRGLSAMRLRLMQTMAGTFSRQDQGCFNAHVTIQNKVDPAVARSLLEKLSATFVAWDGTGRGLMIWRYLGGPWSLDAVLPFEFSPTVPCLSSTSGLTHGT